MSRSSPWSFRLFLALCAWGESSKSQNGQHTEWLRRGLRHRHAFEEQTRQSRPLRCNDTRFEVAMSLKVSLDVRSDKKSPSVPSAK